MRGVLFVLLYTSMIPAALSAAHVGIMFYVWASMIAPDTFTFGVLQQIPFSKIAIFIAILAILRKPAEQKPFFDLTYAFMLAFFCQCAISFAFSLTEGPQFYKRRRPRVENRGALPFAEPGSARAAANPFTHDRGGGLTGRPGWDRGTEIPPLGWWP